MFKFSIRNIKQNKVFIFSSFLFIIPFFWYVNSSHISFGGDSTRFYLNYPFLWLNNYSLNVLNHGFSLDPFHGNNMMIYQLLVYHLLNFFHSELISLLHNSFILVTSFLGFYLTMRETISKYINDHNSTLAILFSFAFSTSQVFSWSIYNNGGLWVYVYSGLPLIIYFFYKFIFEGKIVTLLFFVSSLWIFSSVFLYQLLPFTLPLTTFIFILYFPRLKNNFNSTYVINFLIVFLILLSFNLNNIYSFYFEFTTKSNLFLDNTIIDRVSGVKNIFSVVGDNFFPLLNLKNIDLGIRTNDPYSITNISFLKYSILIGLIFPISIFIHTLSNKNTIKYASINMNIFLCSLFLIHYLLINMNFNIITHNFFLFVFEKIPFFHMFRSYPHKFSFSFVFIYMGYLYFIFSTFNFNKKKFYKYLLIFIFFVVFAQSYPLIFGKIYNLKLWMVNGNYLNQTDFHKDYKELVKKVPENDAGNILSLPFTKEYWIELKDENKAYIGPSPNPLFTNKKDYYGVATNVLYEHLLNKDSKGVNDFLSINNIKYLVFNKKNFSDFEYYLKGNLKQQKILLKYLSQLITSKNLYENDTYILSQIENKNINKCIISYFVRPTIYEINNICEENKINNIRVFKDKLDDKDKFNLYQFDKNIYLNFLSIKFLNPFYKSNNSQKLDYNNKLILIHSNQFISDLLIILSMLFPFMIIFFVTIFKKVFK